MHKTVWLTAEDPFPPEHKWHGWVVAYGADLSPQRLLDAYRKGIFPWYSEGEPIRWCSPDPRAVLPTHLLHIPQRLWREWKRKPFEITADTSFHKVIHACARTPRKWEDGTWITSDMEQAYNRMHDLGYAHSIECWQDSQLVGGLYGLQLGPLFVGESMFYRKSNASKIAFLALCGFALIHNISLIDCQVFTEHLERFGVFEVPRKKYLSWLKVKLPEELPRHQWTFNYDDVNHALITLWNKQKEKSR